MGVGNFGRTWNANVVSDLCFYRLEACSVHEPEKGLVDVKKMMLLR
jgi:hypothetical protein